MVTGAPTKGELCQNKLKLTKNTGEITALYSSHMEKTISDQQGPGSSCSASGSQAMVDGDPVNHSTESPSSVTSILDASRHCEQSKDEDKPICFSYTCVH